MIEHLIGSGLLVAALTSLVHAARLAWPAFAEARKLAATTDHADATARAASEADMRARLDLCESSHRERDHRDALRAEHDRDREIQHARDVAIVRGQLSALHDQFSLLQSESAKGRRRPKGKSA